MTAESRFFVDLEGISGTLLKRGVFNPGSPRYFESEARVMSAASPLSRGTPKTGGGLRPANEPNLTVFSTWHWTGGGRTNGANLYFGTSTLTVFTDGSYTFTQDYHQHHVPPGGTFNHIQVQITLRSSDGAVFLLQSFRNDSLVHDSDVSASWSAGPFSPPPGLVSELSNVFDPAFPALFEFQIS
jgi:hypothetical protein